MPRKKIQKTPGRKRTDHQVSARRAVVWQWYTLGRWSPHDREKLAKQFGVTTRQIQYDQDHVRKEVAERMRLSDTEAIRADLVATHEQLKSLATAHLLCPACQGIGLIDTEPCEECRGTAVRLECSPQWAKVIQASLEQIRKLAGIETPPDAVVAVRVEVASPFALLQQISQGIEAVQATGLLAVPVED